MRLIYLLVAVMMLGGPFVRGEEMCLTGCDNPAFWGVHNGGEFPGAEAGLRKNEELGAIELYYDFSKGGKYVAVFPTVGIPPTAKGFRLKVKASQETMLNYRIVDVSGRTFQGQTRAFGPGTRDVEFSCAGPWSGAWGGKEAAVPQQPLQGFSLMVTDEKSKSGRIDIISCRVECSKIPEQKFAANDFKINACNWNFSGKWIRAAGGPMLEVTAENHSKEGVDVAFDFPEMGRNRVLRLSLKPRPLRQIITYMPLAVGSGNERNIYRIAFTVSDKNGNTGKQMLILRGNQASDKSLGAPVNSKNIKESSIGVCVHFSQRTSGWVEYERLLEMIGESGIKWIRDDTSGVKDGDRFGVCEYELRYLKAARNRGLNTILCVTMSADEELSMALKRIEAVVRDTDGLVDVYELGNEPNNFGNWLKKYGGTWNGWEGDGKVSRWVKEHAKYTNAAAEMIKKIRPAAIVIGLGACSSTNFHALKMGVSPKLDGVVDHPYGYAMPAEQVPWGQSLQSRDGIKTGDENFTYAGLVNSYVEHFSRTGRMRSLWATEFGYSSFWFNGKNETGLYAGYTEEAQACYIVRRLLLSQLLPVKVSCIYDFYDDGGSEPFNAESNFGLVRSDFSFKPVYLSVQRLTSLLAGNSVDRKAMVKVVSQPLHGCVKGANVAWDKVKVPSGMEVKAFGLSDSATPDERTLAVWSTLPYSDELNNRVCSIAINGWGGFGHPVAIDLISGYSYDIPYTVSGQTIRLDNLILKHHPVVIKFFRN